MLHKISLTHFCLPTENKFRIAIIHNAQCRWRWWFYIRDAELMVKLSTLKTEDKFANSSNRIKANSRKSKGKRLINKEEYFRKANKIAETKEKSQTNIKGRSIQFLHPNKSQINSWLAIITTVAQKNPPNQSPQGRSNHILWQTPFNFYIG